MALREGVVLELNGSRFSPGEPITVKVRVTIPIWARFDGYILAETPAGTYTLHLDGRIAEGIEPVVRGMARLDAPLERTVLDRLPCPAGIAGSTELYLATVESGTMPPVRRLSDLRRGIPHVITLHRTRIEVE